MTLPHLHHDFADSVPSLTVPHTAQETPQPRLVHLQEDLARDLGLDPDWLRTEDGLRFLTGERLPPAAHPVAMAYAGHQFGGYSPLLGDGRALLLGELPDPDGRLVDLHVKGSGTTPFTRPGADGQAVLGPMLREALFGESLHALGIPTSRALAVVGTGRPVYRERPLPGAVLVRAASGHVRVGTFQLARHVGGDWGTLRALVDFSLRRHYPQVSPGPNPALTLYRQVVRAQARLVSQWMLAGFVHGVMNTDNLSVTGQTLDLGPCAFIDVYSPSAVFSSIDVQGRYSLGNQPTAARWGLARLGEALLPVLAEDPQKAADLTEDALRDFDPEYDAAWRAGLQRRLGLGSGGAGAASCADAKEGIGDLGERLLGLMAERGADWTSFFRRLGEAVEDPAVRAELAEEGYGEWLREWLREWLALGPDARAMAGANPVVVPRGHLVEEAVDAAHTGGLGPFRELLDRVSRPFEGGGPEDRFAQPPPPGTAPQVTYCGT